MGRGRVGEEREGRALVGPMRDAQNARDDRDRAAHRNAQRNPGLGETVEKDDDGGDEQQPVQTTGSGEFHWAVSGCGGSIFISVSAFWQRVQTFCQMP